jgi:hypothetical protein
MEARFWDTDLKLMLTLIHSGMALFEDTEEL